MFRRWLIAQLLGVLLWASPAGAQTQPQPILDMTYGRALALAREQAPMLAAARARAREAASQIEAASVGRFNPRVSVMAGPRFRSDGTIPQWSVGAQQWLELGGQAGDRIAAARAGADAEVYRHDDARRLLLRQVSIAFISALYWRTRIELGEENLRIAVATARVATRRHAVGEAGGLEPSVAALAVARARVATDRARAAHTRAVGRLKGLLGIPASRAVACRGNLRRLDIPGPTPSDLAERPDIRALSADIGQAEAEAELGRASRVPNVALGARYANEEAEHIVQGTLAIALPVFDRGQGAVAVAEARGERLRAELDATRDLAAVDAHTTNATASRLERAARRFEREGLAPLQRSERLVSASFEAGAIPLIELLTVRRELVQARVEFAELLLAAATARVELAATTGAFR